MAWGLGRALTPQLKPVLRPTRDVAATMQLNTLLCLDCGPRPLNDFRTSRKKKNSGTFYFDSCCNACRKIRSIARNQNITPARYRELLAAAGGRCAICQESTPKLILDHCHITGRLRGFLCHRCNVTLGFFEKGADIQKILDYQKTWALAAPMTEIETAEGFERKQRMQKIAVREREFRTAKRPCSPVIDD
jgi:Recombination endonuclease VII